MVGAAPLSSRRAAARSASAFSCANLPETLVKIETLCTKRRVYRSVFARAGPRVTPNHGTLFSMKWGDALCLVCPPKLPRVLQEKPLKRLGTTRPLMSTVRLISQLPIALLHAMVHRGTSARILYRFETLSNFVCRPCVNAALHFTVGPHFLQSVLGAVFHRETKKAAPFLLHH